MRAKSAVPAARKAAFATERDRNPEVYVMNADGSGPTNVTNFPAAWDVSGKPRTYARFGCFCAR